MYGSDYIVSAGSGAQQHNQDSRCKRTKFASAIKRLETLVQGNHTYTHIYLLVRLIALLIIFPRQYAKHFTFIASLPVKLPLCKPPVNFMRDG